MQAHDSLINAALDLEDPGDFMQAAAGLDAWHQGEAFSSRPDPLGMLGGLAALHLLVTLEGMWKYLAAPEGEDFQEALAWCERVGADKAVAYLRDVAALYPGGQVPREEEARYALVEQLEQEAPLGERDALARLDRLHGGAMDELADRLRSWLRLHRREVADAMERAAQAVAAEPPPESADVTGLIEELERMAEEAEAQARRRGEAAGAVDAGAVLDRLRRFVDGVVGLDAGGWLTAARSYHAHRRAMDDARGRAAGVAVGLCSGNPPFRGGFRKKVYTPALAARQAAIDAARALPEKVETDAKPFPLRLAAGQAVIGATTALMVFEWLASEERGAADAELLLRPFVGLVPVPESVSAAGSP